MALYTESTGADKRQRLLLLSVKAKGHSNRVAQYNPTPAVTQTPQKREYCFTRQESSRLTTWLLRQPPFYPSNELWRYHQHTQHTHNDSTAFLRHSRHQFLPFKFLITSFFACLGLVTLMDPLSVLLDLITGLTPFLKAEVECEGRLDMAPSPSGDSAELLERFFLLTQCELLSLPH